MSIKNFYKLDLQLFAEEGGDAGETVDTPVVDTVSKSTFDKTAAELAKYKKMYNAKLTEEEKANAEKEAIMDELENLRKEKRHSSIVVGLSKSELDEVAIQSIATAVVDGDYEGFTKALLKGVQTALKSKDDEIKRLQLEATERPHNEGSAPKTITREEIAAMSPEEKQQFYNEHRELYESLYK